MMKPIRVAIVGPTGYTGLYLIQLLHRHDLAAVTYLASHRDQLPNIADEFPQLRRVCELDCKPIDPDAIAQQADVVFLCLPHKAAMAYVPALLDVGLRVIDLSADYRLSQVEQYEAIYNTSHEDPDHLEQAVYGLSEWAAEAVAETPLVANPGCYPTAAALGVIPLLQAGMIQPDRIVINAASGVTGAGRTPKASLHFPEQNEAYMAYAVGNHRHQPEIVQSLSAFAGQETGVLFVPHLLPIDRGILETIYMTPANDQVSEDDLFEVLENAYDSAPFVRVSADLPNVKLVRDTNFCDLTVRLVATANGQRHVVVSSAIDNMIKGASGQAIQNMNIMFGFQQQQGLL